MYAILLKLHNVLHVTWCYALLSRLRSRNSSLISTKLLCLLPVQVSTPGVYCNVSAVDFSFRTPLHWAAVLGFDSIVQYLLEVGANPTAADGEGALPLHYAVSPFQ